MWEVVAPLNKFKYLENKNQGEENKTHLKEGSLFVVVQRFKIFLGLFSSIIFYSFFRWCLSRRGVLAFEIKYLKMD